MELAIAVLDEQWTEIVAVAGVLIGYSASNIRGNAEDQLGAIEDP